MDGKYGKEDVDRRLMGGMSGFRRKDIRGRAEKQK